MKDRTGIQGKTLQHGERMAVDTCYINAGAMVIAPSAELFRLLLADVESADAEWHVKAWSPEQSYLARVMAGEWSHISQLYNFETQIHGGVSISKLWFEASTADVSVAHFSGSTKPWAHPADAEVSLVDGVQHESITRAMAQGSFAQQSAAKLRCQVLHAHWHHTWALVCKTLQKSGVDLNIFRGSCTHRPGAPYLVGDLVVEGMPDGTQHLGHVVACGTALDDVTLWRTPPPAEQSFLRGHFGLCERAVGRLSKLEGEGRNAPHSLGSEVVAWLGDGHAEGTVVASHGDDRLVRLQAQAPTWVAVTDLQEAVPDFLRCLLCGVQGLDGRFSRGWWVCHRCLNSQGTDTK
eukprot:5177826-Amphidinium_carterae.1